MAAKTVVALLFGGRSSEHSISCATAAGILGAIDRDRFEVIPVGITRSGAFVPERDDPDAFALSDDALASVRAHEDRVLWPLESTDRRLRVLRADGTVETLGEIDVVFPVLHGLWGEDGTVQGLFELSSLPYVGAGVLASSLAMDKHFTRVVLQQSGLDVVPWHSIAATEWKADPDAAYAAAEQFGYPVFVKPARAGSSVGVSRAESAAELAEALEHAFDEDSRAMIEPAVSGRELEVAVLGGRGGQRPRASTVGEIVVSERGFYDFDAKYRGADGVELVCPAELTADERSALRTSAVRAFEAIGAAGLARVDFFLTAAGPVINEINTLPGFTPISMFPSCWQASGLEYGDLITELIELALADQSPVSPR